MSLTESKRSTLNTVLSILWLYLHIRGLKYSHFIWFLCRFDVWKAWEELFFCLVLAPTRELSGYVEKEFREALSLGDALNKILSNCLDTSTAGADTCQWNAASAICSLSKWRTYNRILIVEARAIPVGDPLYIWNNKEMVIFVGAVTSKKCNFK